MSVNFKHLRYFHEVARLGSVQAAADALHVSPQAISAQVRQLESRIGQQLFRRDGRRLVLTDAGKLARSYAGQIFDLGAELQAALSDHPGEVALPVRIGVTDSVPKSMTVQCTAAGMRAHPERELIFIEGELDSLLGELLTGRIQAILTDREPATSLTAEVDVRLIVQSPMAWVAAIDHLPAGDFPGCLDGAPVILWQSSSALSRQVLTWFRQHKVRPRIVARCVDSALMKSLCAAGLGYAPVPLAIVDSVQQQMQLQPLGVMSDVSMALWLVERPGEALAFIRWPEPAA